MLTHRGLVLGVEVFCSVARLARFSPPGMFAEVGVILMPAAMCRSLLSCHLGPLPLRFVAVLAFPYPVIAVLGCLTPPIVWAPSSV